MKQLFARIVTILWSFILVGLLLPGSNGSPSLHTFLRPDLWWLIASGALITFLFFIVSLKSDKHSHSHTMKGRMGPLIKMLLLVVPAPFILAFGKAEYGTDGLAGKLAMRRKVQGGESPNSTAAEASKAAVPQIATRDSVHKTDLEELLYDPKPFSRQRVRVIGMMKQGSPIPEGFLYCFRYLMVCCAADAMPIGVFIDKPDTFTIEKDAWYEIEGTVHTDSLDGYFIVKMNEVVIRPVEKPKVTWLYPR